MKITAKILQKPTQGQKYVQKQDNHEALSRNVKNDSKMLTINYNWQAMGEKI